MDEKAKAFTARDRVAYELAESRAADTFDENVAAGLFAKFVKNGTWQVPTLVELRNNERGNPVNAIAERTVGTDPRWRYLPAGVQFMAGTDSANTFTLPGFALHEELELLVEAGFTPMEAIQAATLNPAKYLGREKELGTIESGKLADLLLLDANPLVDIRNSQKIRAVVVNGRYLSRADLDSMLSRAEAAAK